MSLKNGLAIAATASLAALLTPASAMALTFNWSFVASNFSTGQIGETISGTISGLEEGSNNGSGVTATVDSTPTGELLGINWTFLQTALGGDAFTVTGGVITFADALFSGANPGQSLGFGVYGNGGYYPNLSNITIIFDDENLTEIITINPRWLNLDSPTTFTPVGDAPVPEPLTILGVGAAIGFGTTFKRKLANAKKK